MPSDVTRTEFDRIEGRVSLLESEVEGEKTVSRYILEQTRRNGDDLAAVKSRLDRVENEVRQLRDESRQLRSDLAGIVAETVREVLRERNGG